MQREQVESIGAELRSSKRLRYAAFMFSILLPPAFVFLGIGAALITLLSALFLSLILRNVDQTFAKAFRGDLSNIKGSLPFILPLLMFQGISGMLDFIAVIAALINGDFSPALAVMVPLLFTKVVVIKSLVPIAQKIVKPATPDAEDNRQPLSTSHELNGHSQAQPAGFKPFTGKGATVG